MIQSVQKHSAPVFVANYLSVLSTHSDDDMEREALWDIVRDGAIFFNPCGQKIVLSKQVDNPLIINANKSFTLHHLKTFFSVVRG